MKFKRNRCKSYTTKFTKCKKFCKDSFCHIHKSSLECCICYDYYTKHNITHFSCNHFICNLCILKLKNFKCPLCRSDIQPDLTSKQVNKINKNIESELLLQRNELYTLNIDDLLFLFQPTSFNSIQNNTPDIITTDIINNQDIINNPEDYILIFYYTDDI